MSRTRNTISRLAVLCIALLLACASAFAQASAPDNALAAKVDEYMNAAVKFRHFGGTILVARNGQPVVSKGYGMADIENDVPDTPQTKFRLGSVTKQFTSMAVMMLQERGKLNVSDPICKHLPDCPAAWQPITIRHLLTHTSGVPNYTSFPDFRQFSRLPTPLPKLIDVFRNKPLDFTPGEKYSYSNSGYVLLGYIIERASGETYADFLSQNIFKPLGMVNTGYETTALLNHRAAGYAYDSQTDSVVNSAYIDMTIPHAAGALYSTVGDLLLWDQALYTERLVSRKSLDEMFTPFKNDYAYGWGVNKQFNRAVLSHGGGINGFSTFIARFPQERLTFIVLGNHEDVATGNIAHDLEAMVFGEAYQIPREQKAVALPPGVLDSYAGQYQLPATVLVITNENGRLMLMQQGAPESKRELLAKSETEFFFKGSETQIRFVRNDKGQVTDLLLGGGNQKAPKIK